MKLLLLLICLAGNITAQTILVAEHGKVTVKQHSDTAAFQIGSVSKTFTAVAVLQLEEKGKIHLNDPLVKYFPSFPYPDITIYHLLTHTSGLPDKEEIFLPLLENHPDTVFTNNDIIPALKKPLAFAPGSEWRYNNIGFALLALLVEKVSGQPFAVHMQQHVFRPAGMHHSYLLGDKNPGMVTGYLPRTHYSDELQPIDSSKRLRPWTYNMRRLSGPTNVITTPQDLLNYDLHKLLKPATIHKMLSPAHLANGNKIETKGEFGEATYGLGWFLQNDTNVIMHSGKEPGFFSFYYRDLAHDKTIIILDNTETPNFGSTIRHYLNIPEPVYKKSLFLPYVKTLLAQGPDAAITFFNQFKSDTTYFSSEPELNELGLELLDNHHVPEALEALKLCTILYPGSWNTYDSYGKALLRSGQQAAAILMYKKSVEMNPQNEPAKKILAALSIP
ncbi:serine hydrolase domain-containing protein [Chitinophaga sp.]|uniref:serine hydrolase domain-containing protein n=1 Tax=Chitinophaga sp. TaxID=1869181 RepID=UPI0031DF761A